MSKPYVEITMSASMGGGDIGEVVIEGVIRRSAWDESDVTAHQLREALNKVWDARRLNIHINSPGGAASQGAAMRALLIEHPAQEKHVYVEGMCASAATLPACIGATVHIYKGSDYMVHNPINIVWGTAQDMENEAAVLRKIAKDVAQIYANQTGGTEEEMAALMDAETWMPAEEAVERGFAHEVIDAGARMCAGGYAGAEIAMLGYKRTPERVKAMEAPDAGGSQLQNRGAQAEGEMAAADGDGADEGEENAEMDIKDITMDALKQGNPELYDQIMSAGAKAERERMQGLEEISMAGGEALLKAAKYEEGQMCGPGEFALRLLKSGAANGAAFMATRREATAAAAQVRAGGTPGETQLSDEEVRTNMAKDIARFAQ